MKFKEAVFTTMYDKIFNITDRATRSEFAWFHVFTIVFAIVFSIVLALILSAFNIDISDAQTDRLTNAFAFFLLVPFTTVFMRRLNDLKVNRYLALLYAAETIISKFVNYKENVEILFAMTILIIFVLVLWTYALFAPSKQ